jgi:hypothetical protein
VIAVVKVPATGEPAIVIREPGSGRYIPARTLISVDLPEPVMPSSAVILPRSKPVVTDLSALVAPKEILRSSHATA